MDKKVYELLNDQINKEFYSAYLYLSFADYYEEEGLSGFANWYEIQAQEERDHALLFVQYLQNKKIAKDFAIYYDLFNKYKSDYQVDKILAGKASDEIKSRAKAAKFDERLALLGLMLDAIAGELRQVNLAEQAQAELLNALKNARMELTKPNTDAAAAVQRQISQLAKKIETGKLASTMSADGEYASHSAISALEDMATMLKEKTPVDGTEAFKLLKAAFDDRTKQLRQQADAAGKQLSHVFIFCEEVFDEGQEMLILVTELTISYYGAHFINRYGCKEYFAHNKELLFYERQKEIITQIEKMQMDETTMTSTTDKQIHNTKNWKWRSEQ